jgi:multidrug efflux pump subunit AcrA (membrane-fusion protein)
MSNVTDSPTITRETGIENIAERNGAESLSDRVRSLRLDGRSATQKSRSSIVPWGLSAILCLVALGLGYRTYRLNPPGGELETRAGDDASKTAITSSNGDATALDSPVASSGAITLQAKGYVIPAHLIQVSPNKVSGIIKELSPNLEEGKQVKQGDMLATIQDDDFRARRDKIAKLASEAERRLEEFRQPGPRN